MSEPKVHQTTQIIAIDDPSNISHVLTLNGNVLAVPTVVNMIKKGHNFSVVDPVTHQVTSVTYVDEDTIKCVGDDSVANNLNQLPTFSL